MISLCHKHYAVWTSIMTLVLLSSVIPSSAGSVVAQENGSVAEPDSALTEMVFLPFVGASSDVVTALTTEDISHQEEWLPYEATYYSFSYPPDREVTEGFGGQYVALYPTEESSSGETLKIEPLMYTQAYQPRSDHYWNCSTYLPNNTTECYMAVVPLTGWGIDPLVSAQSPELRYANVYSFSTGTYYVWVCGYGGTLDDDSVWIGVNGSAASAVDATGHHLASWVWRSIRLSGQRPTINLTFGNQVVNMWAREDGMRVDRILLTKNVNYNPTGNIRCGGY